jgi:predicted metal-dependent hydrolase
MSQKSLSRTIEYGQSKFHYKILKSKRKTVTIMVTPSAEVIVKAPLEADDKKIYSLVLKRARWITQKMEYFEMRLKTKLPERLYISGESHYYLGKAYKLKVIKSTRDFVQLKNGKLNLFVTDCNSLTLKKQTLDDWLKSKAISKFEERFNTCLNKISHWKIKHPQLLIKTMLRRWGSITSTNKLILNTNLIKANTRCIDYVILHELCHLRYWDHSKKFQNLLRVLMPDFEKQKAKLDECVN